ncbi:signal peptidase II [Halobacteriovorax sp. GB3]|uniref:signal peptidase II n=1 Tax=Halobacteriovorax sp. GB3 TaxID=2719615 RepID=UPI00235E83EA|nr:signal peptidase II [Halobacteriovorax sp. GB3]MDD0854798.1 signal peptidase II [Halobacteriovorax sp. GB3]
MDRIWKMTLMMVGIILVDQFTKGYIQHEYTLGEIRPVIDGLFNLTYVQNKGAAFGFGANHSDLFRIIMFLVLPTGACFWLMYLIWQTRHTALLLCTSYSMILAGAIGNLIDRFSLRFVVDMFDFYYGTWHFAAFNVADSAITVGAIFLIYDFLFLEKKRIEKQELKKTS